MEKQKAKLISEMLEAGASAAEVREYIDKWTEAKIRWRAQLIADNELVEAGNAGQEMLWDQAASEGLIDASTAVRVWIVTPDDRLCVLCAPMDGLEASIYGPWVHPLTGEKYNTPNQIHIRCRCSEFLKVTK